MTRLLSLTLAFLVAAFPIAATPTLAQADSAPKAEAPAPAAPKVDAPKADAPVADATKTDAAPAAAADVVKPVADAQGSLSVSSTPSGKVYLDGTDTGLMTPVVDLPVAPGKHTLKIVSADGREQSSDFDIEAGGSLNLNVNLPEPVKTEPKIEEPVKATDVATPEAPAAEVAVAPWTWMTVAGWSGLGLGTIGLLSGAVVLTTPTDPDQPLGFGLFGAGVGLVIGGGVLLYLDTELADQSAAPAAAPAR